MQPLIAVTMDTGHDGDDPAHPLERYGEAGQEGEGEMKGTPRAPWRRPEGPRS